jgi:pimeloyl-ACP methyl ester carboxylesterase
VHIEQAVVLALALAEPAPQTPARAQDVASLRRAGDTAVWAFEQAGQRIGQCASVYEGEVELAGLRAHHFREQVVLRIDTPSGPFEQRYRCELWIDARARPLRMRLEAAVGDSYSSVEATFAAGKAEAAIFQGGKERKLTLDVAPDAYLLCNNFLSQLELALAFEMPAEGEPRKLNLFSGNSLQGLTYEVEHVGPLAESEGGPGVKLSDSLGETLSLDAAGRLIACEVAGQQLVLRRVVEPVEPLALERPAARPRPELDREDVRIQYGDVSLAGTLTRPPGAEGKLPGVFFVSGSGGQDRDGFASGIDLGTHEILDRLTLEGFAVLRVDDRGVGESTGPTEDLDLDDLVEDARQCALFLQARADVDAARIVLIGHSEGAVTVPILAADMEGIAAIVLLAAPGRSVFDILVEQLLAGKRAEGAQAAELEAFERRAREFLVALAAGGQIERAGLPPELEYFLDARAWLASHAKVDPVANLAKLTCPILLLQGERDIQVSAERDARPLAAALTASEHPDFELVLYPELDHLFKRTQGEKPSGLDYLKDRPVDSEVLDKLAVWLRARVR